GGDGPGAHGDDGPGQCSVDPSSGRTQAMNAKMRWGRAATVAMLILVSIISLFPILWIGLTSVKTAGDYFAMPFSWFPRSVTFEHFVRLFEQLGGADAMRNSLLVSTGSMLLTLLVSVPAAY